MVSMGAGRARQVGAGGMRRLDWPRPRWPHLPSPTSRALRVALALHVQLMTGFIAWQVLFLTRVRLGKPEVAVLPHPLVQARQSARAVLCSKKLDGHSAAESPQCSGYCCLLAHDTYGELFSFTYGGMGQETKSHCTMMIQAFLTDSAQGSSAIWTLNACSAVCRRFGSRHSICSSKSSAPSVTIGAPSKCLRRRFSRYRCFNLS